MTANTAETGLQLNEGKGLHAWLVEMLVISFPFQRTRCIFYPCWFMAVSNTSSFSLYLKPVALRSKYMSLGIESLLRWKMLDVSLLPRGFLWCCQALLFLPLSAVRRIPDADGILITPIVWGMGLTLRWIGICHGTAQCLELFFACCVVDSEQLTFRFIYFQANWG